MKLFVARNGENTWYQESAVPPDQAVPPYPDPEHPALRAIVDMAMEGLETGEFDAQAAVRYAALHGWLPGG